MTSLSISNCQLPIRALTLLVKSTIGNWLNLQGSSYNAISNHMPFSPRTLLAVAASFVSRWY